MLVKTNEEIDQQANIKMEIENNVNILSIFYKKQKKKDDSNIKTSIILLLE